MMYGYFYALDNRVQYDLGLAREVNGDRAKTEIGPLARTVIQPLRQWNLRLGPNPQIPVTFEVALEAQGTPYLSPIEEYVDPNLPGTKSQWRSTGASMTIRSGWITLDNYR